jgi:hypothetical protein
MDKIIVSIIFFVLALFLEWHKNPFACLGYWTSGFLMCAGILLN